MQFVLKSIVAWVIVFLAGSYASAGEWDGNWQSSFGELRLVQSGDRVFGDYAERGTIEGQLSKNGKTLRAIFRYQDGRWGTVFWRKAGDKLSGNWNWSKNGIAKPKNGNSWVATKSSARTSLLKFASLDRVAFPSDDPNFTEGGVEDWIEQRSKQPDTSAQNNAVPTAKFGMFFGGYELIGMDSSFEITVEVIQYKNANQASAQIAIYAFEGSTCPVTIHPALCQDIRKKADSRGYVKAETRGTKIVNFLGGKQLWIAFRLAGDSRDRLMVITRKNGAKLISNRPSSRVSIYHYLRGFDYDGSAYGKAHFCENSHCSNDVFTDLQNNIKSYRGVFQRSAHLWDVFQLPNLIEEAHKVYAPQSKAANKSPKPENKGLSGIRSIMTQTIGIFEETGDPLGSIRIEPGSFGESISGEFFGFFETDKPQQAEFRYVRNQFNSLVYDITIYSSESGERKTGRIMFETPYEGVTNPRGTLIVEDEIYLIDLDPSGAGYDTAGFNGQSNIRPTPKGQSIFDLSFNLIGVPEGKRLRLRKSASRKAERTASIRWNASGLTLNNCTPQFDVNSDRDSKIRQMQNKWCEVSANGQRGWLPGRYLSPEYN